MDQPKEIPGHENEALLKIGELAELAGISPKALRIYEQKNIIKPVAVDEETGYRYYSPDQYEQVESLQKLQDIGFSLNEIEQLLSGKLSEEDMTALFEEKRRALNEVIWKAQAQLQELDTIADGVHAKDLEGMTDEERAWHLAKLVRINEQNIRQLLSDVIWL
ncbi:MAG: MerR family transcriptional regulator [Clostridiales bacterium]|nr:MerR family transcriptional regulator [Clostridiales bacterium]